jgi:hypothetical protein
MIVVGISHTASAEWKLDLSRRSRASREADLQAAAQESESRRPASVRAADEGGSASGGDKSADRGLLEQIFDAGEPVQEIVILNTEKGFVPGTVRVRKGGRYTVTVVNVNEKEKNVSFILDGFSEYHATAYGKLKSFRLEPKKDGVFSFQSPETSAEGRLVVLSPQISLPTSAPTSIRGPASEESK